MPSEPNQAEALQLLGVIAIQTRRDDLAIDYLNRALRLKPDFAAAHNNLGFALQRQGKLGEAEASLRQALRLKPDYAEAHNSLGVALWQQGRLKEAAASYQQALRVKPDYAEAHNNIRIVLT